MDFHILDLRQDTNNDKPLFKPTSYDHLNPFPPKHPSFASSSLLHLRPWTDISLNEGSFLKAYGTYEYFERGPPSLVYSIKQCFDPLSHQDKAKFGVRALPALRKFTYTAIFPFANHADFADIVPYLEELDLQFAPDPQSGILDDKTRVGKAELQDCWQELISAYHDLAVTMSTFRMSEQAFPWLKRFVCQDSQIPALREELDEMFTPLCLPVWVNWRHGEFERVVMKAEYQQADIV